MSSHPALEQLEALKNSNQITEEMYSKLSSAFTKLQGAVDQANANEEALKGYTEALTETLALQKEQLEQLEAKQNAG